MNDEAKYRIICDRDTRYDGLLFFAVTTTGIVCRPSCPAARPREDHVKYYDDLSEALRHGYRTCKRCLPELTAPQTITQSTQLPDSETVHAIAESLGISDRHLRRVTHAQVGASPHKLLQSRRVLYAQNLLANTTLPVVDVAFSAGFNSLRQFNDSFRSTAGATPTQYRKAHAGHPAALAETTDLTVNITYQRPMDWQPLTKALLAHMVPGLEIVDAQAQTLRRLITVSGGRHVTTTVSLKEPQGAISVTMSVSQLSDVDDVVRVVRRVFDLDARPAKVAAALGGDPIIGPLLARHPGLRVCGMFDPFELLINTIIGQQVSIPAARTFSARLVKAYGTPMGSLYVYPSARTLLNADPMHIYETTRLNHKKIATIQAVCRLMADGFDLSAINRNAWARKQLLAVKGIGPWTLAYLQLRGFGDPDGFPADDLFIKRFLHVTTAKAAEHIAERWRPYRGYACMQLWTKGSYE